MPIRIILGNDLKRIDRQIKALEYLSPTLLLSIKLVSTLFIIGDITMKSME